VPENSIYLWKGSLDMTMQEVTDYICSLYPHQARRTEYLHETEFREFIPVVDEDVARLLQLLLRLTGARSVLEIGTSIGYSTMSMATVVEELGGRIVTIEYDEEVAEQARVNFDRAGVAPCIQLLIGDARAVMPELEDGSFDFIFLDVDKRLYPSLLPHCVRLLRDGGLLAAEDTLFPVIELDPKWHDLIPSIEEFNRLVAGHEELESTILPIGDGVTLALRKPRTPDAA
jgi:predicted O-methyltransferase YrrM